MDKPPPPSPLRSSLALSTCLWRSPTFAQAGNTCGVRRVFLLTTMAIIQQRDIGLPRERVRLYQLAVDVLLRRCQQS